MSLSPQVPLLSGTPNFSLLCIPFTHMRSSPRGHTRPPFPGLRGSIATRRAATPPLIRVPAPAVLQEVTGRTRLKVVLENLAPEEAAERHGAGESAARSPPPTDPRPQAYDLVLVPASRPASREPIPLGSWTCPGARGPAPPRGPITSRGAGHPRRARLPLTRPFHGPIPPRD